MYESVIMLARILHIIIYGAGQIEGKLQVVYLKLSTIITTLFADIIITNQRSSVISNTTSKGVF